VEFQEAATAAEVDATNALDKDRVPRIYRKTVRNYFDRLGDRFKPPEAKTKEAEKPATDEKKEKEGASGGESETSNEEKP
jgi:hypothetical protein